ncbi:MAG: hypothetical protein R3D85_17370 [Paracoccaceae bacterium]
MTLRPALIALTIAVLASTALAETKATGSDGTKTTKPVPPSTSPNPNEPGGESM